MPEREANESLLSTAPSVQEGLDKSQHYYFIRELNKLVSAYS